MDIVGILETNMDYFSQDVLWITAIRQIGWILVKALKGICDACENLFNDMYSLLDFTEYPALRDFFDGFQPVIAAVFILSLLALGIMLTMGHNKGIKVVQNLVIFVAVVTALPVLITNLNKLVISGKDAIYSNVTSMSDSLIKSDVDDVAYMINNGFDGNEFKVKGNNISEDKISIINVNEVLEPDGIVYDDYEELITTQLDFINEEGQWETKEIKDKWFSIFDPPYYYRYHVEFFLLYVGLISLIIAFICTAYKTVRIIFEIVTAYLLAIIFSSEISGGRKIVKILDNLKNLYIALLMTVVMIKIFVLANDYINARDFGTITKTFALLFFTLCLIDGPNIVEKVLGVDIGLSSAWGKMATTVTAARGAGKIASGAVKTTRNVLFGNPNSPNSKGGITGRMRDVFGSVTESENRSNPNEANKKAANSDRGSSAFPRNHTNDGNTVGRNEMSNAGGTSSTNSMHNVGDMTNRGDVSKGTQDKNVNSPVADDFREEISSPSAPDKQNTGEVTGYTEKSGDIYNNDGVASHHPNAPTMNTQDDGLHNISPEMEWYSQESRNAFDNHGNLTSDIPADMMWTPKNENESDIFNGVSDDSQKHDKNMPDNIDSFLSKANNYEQTGQSPNMEDIYKPQGQSSNIKGIQPSSKIESVSEGKIQLQSVDVSNTSEPKYLHEQKEYLSKLEAKVTNTEYMDYLESKTGRKNKGEKN